MLYSLDLWEWHYFLKRHPQKNGRLNMNNWFGNNMLVEGLNTEKNQYSDTARLLTLNTLSCRITNELFIGWNRLTAAVLPKWTFFFKPNYCLEFNISWNWWAKKCLYNLLSSSQSTNLRYWSFDGPSNANTSFKQVLSVVNKYCIFWTEGWP